MHPCSSSIKRLELLKNSNILFDIHHFSLQMKSSDNVIRYLCTNCYQHHPFQGPKLLMNLFVVSESHTEFCTGKWIAVSEVIDCHLDRFAGIETHEKLIYSVRTTFPKMKNSSLIFFESKSFY